VLAASIIIKFVITLVRFQVFTAVGMKMAVFWDLITLITETASTSETSVNFNNNPENSRLHVLAIFILHYDVVATVYSYITVYQAPISFPPLQYKNEMSDLMSFPQLDRS
jgi:hypothetical protein